MRTEIRIPNTADAENPREPPIPIQTEPQAHTSPPMCQNQVSVKRVSIVIPARNEAALIGTLLEALRPGVEEGRFEVVVVPNGCTDDTGAIARRHQVAVVELAESSKIAALNAGDGAVTGFPRFYVDGDIVITAEQIDRLAATFDDKVLAVAPGRRLDTSRSSYLVRSYLRIWDRLPSTRSSLAGRGCYGVSAVGRERWGAFPDIIADDGFVNGRFSTDERRNVDDVTSIVRAPRDVRSLVSRLRRSRRGNMELASEYAHESSNTAWLRVVAVDPRLWLDAPVYLVVTLLVRCLARADQHRGRTDWTTDESTRSGA